VAIGLRKGIATRPLPSVHRFEVWWPGLVEDPPGRSLYRLTESCPKEEL
jgi:hypothetical protein